jgi:glycosyltransferase involved in cell wall biosynthesis
MRIIHVSYSDTGGAGRAAYRIHCSLLDSGIESKMQVMHSVSGDHTVDSLTRNIKDKILQKSRELPAKLLSKSGSVENSIIHSIAVLPSGLPAILNNSDADVIHLHWVGRELLSVKDISNINKPIVWTFHDMWPFCGAEHVSYDNRYKDGYRAIKKSSYSTGFDLNQWTWKRKKKHWKKPIEIVTPSRWMAECVQESALMSDWPVTVIPNPIDARKWEPIEKDIARKILGYQSDCLLVAFGSYGENQQYHKGADLLKLALAHIKESNKQDVKLVVIGQNSPIVPDGYGFPAIYGGFLHDDISLRLLYSAVDAIIIPSRIESFSQMASEAHVCGTPVIAFNVCGLRDIVDNRITGYLANAFDAEDLAEGIRWVLSDKARLTALGQQARIKALKKFDKAVVSQQYKGVYRKVIEH